MHRGNLSIMQQATATQATFIHPAWQAASAIRPQTTQQNIACLYFRYTFTLDSQKAYAWQDISKLPHPPYDTLRFWQNLMHKKNHLHTQATCRDLFISMKLILKTSLNSLLMQTVNSWRYGSTHHDCQIVIRRITRITT